MKRCFGSSMYRENGLARSECSLGSGLLQISKKEGMTRKDSSSKMNDRTRRRQQRGELSSKEGARAGGSKDERRLKNKQKPFLLFEDRGSR